ncbi:DNA repair exonuclease [Bacillus sp. EB600]|uniref:metallophosphoesterase family protein n=1 Tax=Bacillus sp. EB600 TaxID=2806345 RepID=UPI00210E27E2|nr:DNA repair exonuclease [Bacillus sp. EB600]MCQ6280675.1 DNA repair exonuclease [Bacillus sp. EB600]
MKKVTFIHAADLHLDSPMVGLKHLPEPIFKRIKESTFVALKKLTQSALEKKVDFVILAGDLFDGEDRSLRAQSRLRTEMLRLEAKGIPVYVVHGNHDHLGGTWVNLDMPANVHVFSSDVEVKTLTTKSGIAVNFYGFSYLQRHVYDRKIDHYLRQEGADFHIGILHGNEGQNKMHGNYAPFYLKELLDKQFNYWALGHIHKRTILSEHPLIVYPGNIQGRNKKETGMKGFYHVSLTELDDKLEFVESSDVIWDEAVIDAKGAKSFQDVLQLCHVAINEYRRNNAGTLLTLHLNNIHIEDSSERRVLDGELVELLQEEERDEESFVWIVDLTVQEELSIDKDRLKNENGFYQELLETAEGLHPEQALAALYEHSLGRKYLSPLSTEDQQQLLEKAENLLIKLLIQS